MSDSQSRSQYLSNVTKQDMCWINFSWTNVLPDICPPDNCPHWQLSALTIVLFPLYIVLAETFIFIFFDLYFVLNVFGYEHLWLNISIPHLCILINTNEEPLITKVTQIHKQWCGKCKETMVHKVVEEAQWTSSSHT